MSKSPSYQLEAVVQFVEAFLRAEQEVQGWTSTLAALSTWDTDPSGQPRPAGPNGKPPVKRPSLMSLLVRTIHAGASSPYANLTRFAAKSLKVLLPTADQFFEPGLSPEIRRKTLEEPIEVALKAALATSTKVWAGPDRTKQKRFNQAKAQGESTPTPRLRVGLRGASTTRTPSPFEAALAAAMASK
ncbi:MAG: hypothetical protein ABIF09_05805 [Gemmatimonadota bacterium]